MFELKFEERMSAWRNFRESLETSKDPIQDTIDFYNKAPICKFAADPYTPSCWPDPWELLEENNYCPFVKILAICYTLQLTDCLSRATYKIHIKHDKENSTTYYLLYINDRVVGFNGELHVHKNELPKNLFSQFEHAMLPIS